MKLSKKDHQKIYGARGLLNKSLYIRKVISSCKTMRQLDAAFEWGINVVEQECDEIRENLSKPWLVNPTFYKVYIQRYLTAVRDDIYNERIKTLRQLL